MSEQGSRPDDRQIGMSARQTFVLLALLFLAPMLITWLMMSGGRSMLPEGTTNHGTLVQPARLLELPEGVRTAAGEPLAADYLLGKWTLVYFGDGACDDTCLQNLYKMRQVRLAQNENVKRVQRLYLLTDSAVPDDLPGKLENYAGMEVAPLSPGQLERVAPRFAVNGDAAEDAGRVYVVDPRGYLMMYYGPDAEPGGMLKDLKKLLKYSRIG